MDRKKIFLVSLGHVSCDINGGALPACLPYVRAAYNLDYQATGGLMFAYSCLSSLIQPLFGFLADKHSKPWFIPVGVILAGCGLAIMGFMSQYWLICAGVAISGVGSAFFHPEAARFANRVAGKTKGAALSFFSIGGNAGFLLGPLLAPAAIGAFGLRGMGLFALLALVMAAVLCLGISRMPALNKKPDDVLAQAASLAAANPAQAEADELAETPAPGKNDWREFGRLALVIVCRAMVFTGCNTFIPLYWVNSFGQSKSAGAVALAVFVGSGIAFNLVGGFLSDRIGYVNVVRLAFTIMAPVVFLFGSVNDVVYAWLILPLLGVALFLSFSAQVALGQSLLAKNVGLASGITLGVATTLGGVAQPCLGWLADSRGLNAVFVCLSLVALAGATFSYLLRNDHKTAK